MSNINHEKLRRELMIDAKALGIPVGSAEVFIERTLKSADKSLRYKTIITKTDLKKAIARELKKYHKDFAYVYEKRDKII